jgi:hypothetical protein
MKRGWFGSLPTTNVSTVGKVSATRPQNASMPSAPLSAIARALAGYTASTGLTPRAIARSTARRSRASASIVVGAAGSHLADITIWVRPTSRICV